MRALITLSQCNVLFVVGILTLYFKDRMVKQNASFKKINYVFIGTILLKKEDFTYTNLSLNQFSFIYHFITGGI